MDNEIKKRAQETVDYLRSVSVEDMNFDDMDPIAKMMLIAVMHEGQKLRDYIDETPQKVAERYCSDFIPYEKVGATPAITLLHPTFKNKTAQNMVMVGSGASFAYKKKDEKLLLNYIPVFETSLLPFSDIFLLAGNRMQCGEGTFPITMPTSNRLWLGIVTDIEIESLRGLSLLVRGTNGILPSHIYVGTDNRGTDGNELEFATMLEMENIDMLEPFDAQQSSGQFFSFINNWKEFLLNMNDAALLYITDTIQNRDLFKPHPYPKYFQQWLENEDLDRFRPNTLWLQLDFPEGYVIPDMLQLDINILPVANVDVNSLTLNQSTPIAKLQKQENAFFLRIIETSTATHKQGFNMTSDDIIIRDFDASRYHNGDLYRDVRNLYNHFTDDYYAFMEYNGIRDGNVLAHLRKTINALGKGVGQSNEKFKFDSGTYVMRNISQEDMTTSTKVSYMTTMGEIGNMPKIGETMEQHKLPAINQKVDVLVGAMGGTDKISPDARYEMLRYYTLTNDRLYTRMDIDAFLRKEIMNTFGRNEYHRIFIRINVEGAGGERSLRRGLYIDIDFKDRKNYDEARRIAFDTLMRQRITNLSCIAMPIIVTLNNLEG